MSKAKISPISSPEGHADLSVSQNQAEPQGRIEEFKGPWWKISEETKLNLRAAIIILIALGVITGFLLMWIPGIKNVAAGLLSALSGLFVGAGAVGLIYTLIAVLSSLSSWIKNLSQKNNDLSEENKDLPEEKSKALSKKTKGLLLGLGFGASTIGLIAIEVVFDSPIFVGFFGGTVGAFLATVPEYLGFVAGRLGEATPIGIMIGLSVGLITAILFWATRAAPTPEVPAAPKVAEGEGAVPKPDSARSASYVRSMLSPQPLSASNDVSPHQPGSPHHRQESKSEEASGASSAEGSSIPSTPPKVAATPSSSTSLSVAANAAVTPPGTPRAQPPAQQELPDASKDESKLDLDVAAAPSSPHNQQRRSSTDLSPLDRRRSSAASVASQAPSTSLEPKNSDPVAKRLDFSNQAVEESLVPSVAEEEEEPERLSSYKEFEKVTLRIAAESDDEQKAPSDEELYEGLLSVSAPGSPEQSERKAHDHPAESVVIAPGYSPRLLHTQMPESPVPSVSASSKQSPVPSVAFSSPVPSVALSSTTV